MSDRKHGVPGLARHMDGTAKLSPDVASFVERLVRTRGLQPTAAALRTSTATLDIVLSRGVKVATRDRLEAAARRLIDAAIAEALGAEVLS